MISDVMKTSSATDPGSERSGLATVSDTSEYQNSLLNECKDDIESNTKLDLEGSSSKMYQASQLLSIYTEWANHYLEKAGFQNFVNDLQTDLCDGTLLADIIIAVTGEKVPNTKVKPKTQMQQMENLNSCLIFLSNIGVVTEGILSKDINEGSLKAILGLLFNLSRYKQQLKQQSSSASTPSAVSSNGSTLSGNNNVHKSNNRASILRNSTTGIPTLSGKSSEPQPVKPVASRKPDGLLCKKNLNNNNNNPDVLVASVQSKRNSTIKTKKTDSLSNSSSISSTYSTGIPLPANITNNTALKSSPLTGDCHSVSCSSNSPVLKKSSNPIIDPGTNMFDRFKLFRNSANERINRGSPLHSYSGMGSKDGGSILISDPVAHRSMTPFDPRMVHNLNTNSPLPGSPGKMQTVPYSMFSLVAPSDGQFHPQQPMQPSFQNYSQNVHDIKFQPCAPIRTESSKQSASFKENNAHRGQDEIRKPRSKESDSSRNEPCTGDAPARSSSRHERQKAKDLYTALKQRDRNKYNFSPQVIENCEQTRESVNNKQSRIMTSEEFTQLIQNDPRLRQYVEKQSNAKRNLINLDSSKMHCQAPSEVPRKQSTEVKPGIVQNRAVCEDSHLPDSTQPEAAPSNISDKNRRKSLESKPKSTPATKLDSTTYSNVMGKKEPLLWMQSRPSISGTDSSEYSSHYSCMRKYASDFEADFDLDSSVEMSTQTDKMTAKMGYYSDSDSILNPRFGKLDSGPNNDLSALISQKMVGFRRLMNTSGMDPAAYLSYQKNLMASKRGTPQSADKDRIYGIVLNSNVARSAAGPAPATFDDLQLQSCFSLPSSQNFLRSNSARYSDTVSSEKSFPQTIKLPYATNTNSFIGKAETTDSSQNIGSNLSLTSNDSRRSMSEDKQSQEIRKLRHELEIAQQKILTLSSRLTTNGHMASAFELSLMNMTERLQKLSETSERKDHELIQLRSIIDSFRQQGLNINEQASLPSIGVEKTSGVSLGRSLSATVSPAHFQNSLGRMKRNGSNTTSSEYESINNSIGLIGSSESCTSLVSTDVGSSNEVDQIKKQVKKGWFRSSLGKAFRKKLKHSDYSIPSMEGDYFIQQSPDCRSRMSHDSHTSQTNFTIDSSNNTIENLKKQLQERDLKLTDAQLDALSSAHQLEQLKELLNAMRCEMSTLRADNERLQKLVRVESDTNETNYNTGDEDSNTVSIGTRSSMANKISDYLPDTGSSTTSIDTFSHLFKFSSPNEVSIGTYVHFEDVIISTSTVQNITNKVLIGSCHISENSTWSQLETHIKCLFKEYLNFNDPFANLGINAESIEHYSIGSVQKRFINEENPNETDFPTPFESLVDNESESEANQIKLILRCTKLNNSVLDALAFDTLIPKTVLHRYVSLLLEHRLIILCGPSGTGKTYLANKLAKHLIIRHKQEVSSSTLAMFTVDHKSNKELRTYLTTIADQTQLPTDGSQSRSSGARTPPVVVILDNLHHVNSLAEIFDSFLSSNIQNRPYVIGTMTQASFSNTNLQAHHNFRWVLCANHMEPVKGFLGRYLRRKLIQTEWQEKKHDDALLTTVEWISKVWQHINKFLESHSSSDVTIGPRLFLSCPMSMEGSQIWFTDLWNYSLVPYLLEAVREGLQTFGRRSNWEDPVDWILQTWPWTSSTVKTRNSDPSSLIRLRPEDVGYDSQVPLNISVTSSGSSNCQSAPPQLIPHSQHQKYLPDSRVISMSSPSPHRNINSNNTFPRTDPLLNMLIKLQEAANYSTSPSSNDSDKPSSKSSSLCRINSSSSSAGQASQIHKIFKTDIL